MNKHIPPATLSAPTTRSALVTTAEQRTNALQESEERFRLTFELAAVGIAHVGVDGSWLRVNQRLCDIVGYTREEMLQLTFQNITHPEELTVDLDYVRRMLAGELDRYQMEKRYVRKDGTTVWGNLSVSLVRDVTTHEPLYFISVIEDIDARKRAEQTIAEQADLLRLSQDAIAVRRLDGTVLSWNPAAESLYGWTEEEARGRSTHSLLQTRFPISLEEQEQTLLHTGVWEGELVHTRKDGRPLIVSSRQALRRDTATARTDGSYGAVLESNRDITERVLYEQRQRFLLDLGEQVRPLTTPDAILEVTVRAVDEFLSPSHCRFLEVNTDSGTITLRHHATAGHTSRPVGDAEPLSRVMTREMIALLQQGEVLALADTASDPLTAPVYTTQLETLGIRAALLVPCLRGARWVALLGIDQDKPRVWTPEEMDLLRTVADRTWLSVENARLFQEARREVAERRRAEERLRELNETLEERVAERTTALQEANTSLESFNHVVAHDLRAPLRAMQGFAQALEEDYAPTLDAEAKEYITYIVQGADRMNALLTDLLAYSRLTRADLRASLVPVSLDLVVRDALKTLEADIDPRGAAVTLKDTPFPTVLAHRATLGQIVLNLISNAVKFVPEGTPPRVRVWTERRQESSNSSRVRLWVEDNGIGIAPAHQERIWRIFERLHGIEQYPGTGIGLAIVAKGIERMGGTVGVESGTGQGSRFWIELPEA